MSETGNRSERGLIHIYCGDGKGKTTGCHWIGSPGGGKRKTGGDCPFFKDR